MSRRLSADRYRHKACKCVFPDNTAPYCILTAHLSTCPIHRISDTSFGRHYRRCCCRHRCLSHRPRRLPRSPCRRRYSNCPYLYTEYMVPIPYLHNGSMCPSRYTIYTSCSTSVLSRRRGRKRTCRYRKSMALYACRYIRSTCRFRYTNHTSPSSRWQSRRARHSCCRHRRHHHRQRR